MSDFVFNQCLAALRKIVECLKTILGSVCDVLEEVLVQHPTEEMDSF